MPYLPLGPRRYRCLACGHEFTTSTNHDGKIYNFPCPRKDRVFADGGPVTPGVYECVGEVREDPSEP